MTKNAKNVKNGKNAQKQGKGKNKNWPMYISQDVLSEILGPVSGRCVCPSYSPFHDFYDSDQIAHFLSFSPQSLEHFISHMFCWDCSNLFRPLNLNELIQSQQFYSTIPFYHQIQWSNLNQCLICSRILMFISEFMTIFLLDRVNCADSAYFITETFKPLIDENDNNVNIRLKFLRAEFANTKWSPSGQQVVWSPSGRQVVTK